ncbi:MAG: Crp/Fnr family transcriptional regulator [Anaerolineales bacterium]|jgi:CRP-like cAMP-binding protein|nr:Crp/Fnr family transcriptional regulator [Anaerolineales bacterium]
MDDQALFESTLRRVAVFDGSSDADIKAVARLGILRTVEEDGFFFMQGDPAEYLYIMLNGRAKLCQIALDGQQVNLRTLNPNELFGAVGAVEKNAPYPACAQALQDSSAIAIPSDPFHTLLEQRPHLSFGLMKLMTSYIQEMQDRYRESVTEKVEQRIARVLLRLAGQTGKRVEQGVRIELPFSRQDLAEMAGTTLYTVSRTLSAWEKQGLIATGRERVTLTHPHAVMRLAEGLE